VLIVWRGGRRRRDAGNTLTVAFQPGTSSRLIRTRTL
jgi:hypothetical protein